MPHRRLFHGKKPLTLEREYDMQLSHTIWELERTVGRGGASDSVRRTLVESHLQHIRQMEEIAQVPRQQRTQLLLQARPADTLLLLPGEGGSADDLSSLTEAFHRRGFGVMTTNLSYRVLDKPGKSPLYWQTCADEAENRVDVLAHYSTRVAILGVGLSGIIAVHVATRRNVGEVVALFPPLDAGDGFLERVRAVFRRLLRRAEEPPRGWPDQRRAAARTVRATLGTSTIPLYVLVEDRRDRSEVGRASVAARSLVARAATKVRVLGPGEAASVRELPPVVFDEILAFLQRR